MWHLEKPSQKTLDEYVDMMLPALKSRINNNSKTTNNITYKKNIEF